MDTTAAQRALIALGYSLEIDGVAGTKTKAAIAAFQRWRGLAADGIVGPQTAAALQAAVAAKGQGQSAEALVVPLSWMPAAQMSRIIVHWTAGSHRASGLDRSHYHLLIEGDGKLVRGIPPISLNDAHGCKPGYAAHTLNCNTGSIGVSLCCMAGAVESPFNAGPAPMTRVQWDALPGVLADLCRRYGIPITPKTVLSHAEVQPVLNIQQRGKWDISRLAFDHCLVGATACGDAMRAAASLLIA